MTPLRSAVANWLRSQRQAVPALVVAALLRFGLMIVSLIRTGTTVMTQGDTESYLEPGRNLILHRSFLHGAFSASILPELDRTPGYPIFLMLTGMFTGNVLLTVSVQILLSLASLLLVRSIADRVFPNSCPAGRVGLLAAWLFAIEPLSIVYSVRLLPETLFGFLLLAAIDRLLAFLSTRRLFLLFVSGLLLAAATYVRPVSYYLVFPLSVALAIECRSSKTYILKAPAVLLLAVLPLLAAWQARNFLETGYAGFSSVVEKNLYFYQAAEVTAQLQHISFADEQQKLGYADEISFLSVHPEQRNSSQAQRLRFLHTEAMRQLSLHRGLYFASHFRGVAVVAFTPSVTELLQLLGANPDNANAGAATHMPHPPHAPLHVVDKGILQSVKETLTMYPIQAAIMALFEVCLLGLYAFALIGCIRGSGLRASVLLLVGVALYLALISGGAQAVGRYRTPIMPELCVLAAGGLLSRPSRHLNPSANKSGIPKDPALTK